jgi:hypothetical protein
MCGYIALWLKLWTAAAGRNPNKDIGKWVEVYVLFAVATILLLRQRPREYLELLFYKQPPMQSPNGSDHD